MNILVKRVSELIGIKMDTLKVARILGSSVDMSSGLLWVNLFGFVVILVLCSIVWWAFAGRCRSRDDGLIEGWEFAGVCEWKCRCQKLRGHDGKHEFHGWKRVGKRGGIGMESEGMKLVWHEW